MIEIMEQSVNCTFQIGFCVIIFFSLSYIFKKSKELTGTTKFSSFTLANHDKLVSASYIYMYRREEYWLTGMVYLWVLALICIWVFQVLLQLTYLYSTRVCSPLVDQQITLTCSTTYLPISPWFWGLLVITANKLEALKCHLIPMK